MKATRYIIMIGFVCGLVLAACSKDEPADNSSQTEDVRSRGAAVQDSAKNDSVQGGVGFKLETEWIDSTTVEF